THRNTAADEARFEVPGRRWMDLSQPGCGLAVLDDGRIGRSADGATLGLSLLRAPRWPAPGVDRGVHRFTYALLPHGGDWRAAAVPAAADELAEPFVVRPCAAATGSWRPFALELREPGSIEIACCKAAADGDGTIVRLVERHGGRQPLRLQLDGIAGSEVAAVDLLERPLPDGSGAPVALSPFQVLTLRVGGVGA
ncbi:MAG: alpha-mannosidase, partial [Planctomycetes bacterium]|nr:alpha-mannosidase [Planctomycetota bacterium]